MRLAPPTVLLSAALCIWSLTLEASRLRAAEPVDKAPPPLEISRDTVLDPGQVYRRIVITASNITLDGRGAHLIGDTQGKPREFRGVAISATGVSGVTVRNIKARGWETGLKVQAGSKWLIEDCDFSDNFHDPDFGWGEQGRRGGIVLEQVDFSTLRRNKANRVWDGCVLVEANENVLEDNDFSHTSNTCLKLWNASRNQLLRNNLSYGIRIKPGEVHARDSTSVLIESGSNDNHFVANDCTHGGDGIFIRVLNGWVSTGNVFERNDCSYANNNCVEAWSPRNTYRENKANHGSYGFWLGASDQTVLIGNEASYNGQPKGNHNSPHLPNAGHAGIVFMFGPSSHTIVRGNTCVGNNGAGIALIGDQPSQGKKWKAYHWILEQNTLRANRWGVFASCADWINLANNTYEGNSEEKLRVDEHVTNLTDFGNDPQVTQPPQADLRGPSSAIVGQPVVFDASASKDPAGLALRYRWDLGDGTVSTEPRVAHSFQRPGFHRVGLTVNNGRLSDLAWRDFYAVERLTEFGTEGQASDWTWADPGSKATFSNDREILISGASAMRALVKPYSGGRVSLLYPSTKKAGLSLQGKTYLVFWIKAINENVPAWQDVNPLVTLYESDSRSVVLRPAGDFLSQRPNNEEREGWTYFTVPLSGSPEWKREGEPLQVLNYLSLGFDSWGAPPLQIWIDGLSFK